MEHDSASNRQNTSHKQPPASHQSVESLLLSASLTPSIQIDPSQLTPTDIIQLQRTYGNRFVQNLLTRKSASTITDTHSLTQKSAMSPLHAIPSETNIVQRIKQEDLAEFEAFYLREIREIGDPFAKKNWSAYQKAKQEEDLPTAKRRIREHIELWKANLNYETFEPKDKSDPNYDPEGDHEKRFYLALNKNIRLLLATVVFGGANEVYNPEYWRISKNDNDALVLKSGKTPSEGINQLLEYKIQKEGYVGLESAKLDCVEIIEVARWLSELDVKGQELFNQKYGGKRFSLSAPGSTGIKTRDLAIRVGGAHDKMYDSGGGPKTGIFEFIGGNKTGQKVKLEDYLPTLPVGARVMWRNFDPSVPHDDDFKNENTIKIDQQNYAAHPFGIFTLPDIADHVGQGGFEDVKNLRIEIKDHKTSIKKLKLKIKNLTERVLTDVPKDDLIKHEETLRKRKKDLKEHKKDLEEKTIKSYRYQGIDSLQDYVNRFIRLVEIETLQLPE